MAGSRFLLALLAPLAAAASLAGCREPARPAAYRFEAGEAYTLEYRATLTGKAEGVRGERSYEALASARLAFAAAPDSAAGRATLSLSADSVSYRASDRDPEEGRYMGERLRRYKAELVLSRTGQLLSLSEEPDLPPVELSPVSFGRYLAYGMPALPPEGVSPGMEWTVEQGLLDKFHPEARAVKRYRAVAIRETPEGRLLESEVEVRVFLEEGLGGQGSGSPVDTAPAGLTGRGETVFNLDRGLPVSSDLDLEGRFISSIPGTGPDSARAQELPVRLAIRLSLRFGR